MTSQRFLLRVLFVIWLGLESAQGATLRVELTHEFEGERLSLGTDLHRTTVGQAITVTRLDYLLSDFQWVSASGAVVELTNQFAYVSVGGGRTTFTLTELPAGTYSALRFRVGVNPVVNHADFTVLSPDHPLHPEVNGLHWGWQGGYVFWALEGRWTHADGSPSGYSYHLATDRFRLPVEIPVTLDASADTNLEMSFDLGQVFRTPFPFRLTDDNASTHSRSTDSLAEVLAGRVVRAFKVRSVKGRRHASPPVAVAAAPLVASNAPPYRLKIAATFPQPRLPQDNPLTEPGVELGRQLFHDVRLSAGERQSCASCHAASAGFVDAGQRFSRGSEGQLGSRNAMPLVNLAWQKVFFWDGRAASLREQVLQPIVNPVEMRESLDHVVTKLSTVEDRARFQAAFGSSEITADRVARALEQYLLTLVSYDSKFDRVIQGKESFTAAEQRGFELFHTEYDPAHGLYGADCFHCHGGVLFTDGNFHNNGLDTVADARDLGRFLVTTNRADLAQFKTPTLRNVAVTGPYMHDGRFQTLEEVVAHYATGVKASPILDPNLAKHPSGGVPLSRDDQSALVAFLNTLTDRQLEVTSRGSGPTSSTPHVAVRTP